MLQEQSLGKGEKIMSIAKMLNRTMFDIEKIGNFNMFIFGDIYMPLNMIICIVI